MKLLTRAYYHATFEDFLSTSDEEIIGYLSLGAPGIDGLQMNAWVTEIAILRQALIGLSGYLLLEYSIPRMGKRVDAILLFPNVVVVVEFKIGDTGYSSYALDQVIDYVLDLKNFQEQSHNKLIVPMLLASNAAPVSFTLKSFPDGIYSPVCTNPHEFGNVIRKIIREVSGPQIEPESWLKSAYCPTPTIIEAAQALYKGHNVSEISRSEAGAENLTRTANAIKNIVSECRDNGDKAICFITGVPGAGKTLAGLNIANSWHDPANGEHAVFLSGNGPLVQVLREALARNDVERARESNERKSKSKAISEVKAFVQNIHHFRDDALSTESAPIDRVAIFDEAQRAWDLKKTADFMRSRKGILNFAMSEPEFLISVMNRHIGWATIICLIGGGQEIYTGEAGLAEWFRVLRHVYPDWRVFISGNISDSEYADALTQEVLTEMPRLEFRPDLHLATSIRSFRAESVSALVKAMLDREVNRARELLGEVLPTFPVLLTRDINTARLWLKQKSRGTERCGIIASSEAQRLKPFGLHVKAEIDPTNWFLNEKTDIRSSFYLEDVATEFQIQGLELDWICVAWDCDLRYGREGWGYYCFRGTKWKKINNTEKKRYLKNAYRVLLTRARQGMVIFIPEGDNEDLTRLKKDYDCTYEYLRNIGIPELQ